MSEMVRCPACRGSKKVAKLGGIMGDCNMCSGSGQIKECDRPKPILIVDVEPVVDVIKAVEHVAVVEELPIKEAIKIDGKKALYRKKKA